MKKSFFHLVTLSIFVLLLSACGAANVEPTATPAPTNTPSPTATFTATPPSPLVILVIPPELDQELSNLYQDVVYELAQQSNLRFQVRNTLTPEEAQIEPGLQAVILIPPAFGITELAASAPQIQFLAVNMPEVSAANNLSVVASTVSPDVPAFLLGYIAAMLTEDYRIGMILPADYPNSDMLLQAYEKGMEYFCGLCQPWGGPFHDYPIHVRIPENAQTSELPAYVDFLTRQYKVETMYVLGSAATDDLLTYASGSGVLLMGTSSPAKRIPNWVVTIQPDVVEGIKTAWPDLAAGIGGKQIVSPLALTDINPDFLTPGKQRLAFEVLNGLLSGEISTSIDP